MSFATSTPRRGSERFLAIFTALAVLMTLMVIYAPAALAHHPTITAGQTCVYKSVVIQYESVSWKTDGTAGSGNPDIRIEVSDDNGASWTEVAVGAYNAGNNYRFSGGFDGEPYWNQTIIVRARAAADWDNGNSGGQTNQTAAFLVSEDCFNPSCSSEYFEYKVEPVTGGTHGPNDEFTITLGTESDGAPDGPIFDWTSTVPVYQVIVKGGPGANVYDYGPAQAGSGLHAPVNPNNGSYYGLSHITFCYGAPQDQPVTVTVIAGHCQVDDEEPGGMVEIQIDPALGASVQIYDSEDNPVGDPITVSTTVFLAPGDYSWEATAADGYENQGDPGGTFEIEDCVVVVTVVAGACENIDGPLGEVVVTVDPEDGAKLTIKNAAGEIVFKDDETESVYLPPGTYTWKAKAEAGFEFEEGAITSGEFTIEPCEATVAVSGQCVLDGGIGQGILSVELGEGVDNVKLSVDGTVTLITESGDYPVAVGETYFWVANPEEGFAIADGQGSVTIEDCSEDEVEALTITSVAVTGSCVVNEGVASGSLDIQLQDGVEKVEIFLNGALVTSATDSGSYDVAVGNTYDWKATAAAGYEFGSAGGEGTVTVEDCTPDEVADVVILPFTGMDSAGLAGLSIALLVSGLYAVLAARRREEGEL